MTDEKTKGILSLFWGRDKPSVQMLGTFELCPILSSSTGLYLAAIS